MVEGFIFAGSVFQAYQREELKVNRFLINIMYQDVISHEPGPFYV